MSDDYTRRGKAILTAGLHGVTRVVKQTETEPAHVIKEVHVKVYPTHQTEALKREPGRLVADILDGDLTADQLTQLADAEARPVDTTDPDAPELPAEAWAAGLEARRRRLLKPSKEAISIRLDADVLAWFRGQGPGYQREINRLLRERMELMDGRLRTVEPRSEGEAAVTGRSDYVTVSTGVSLDTFLASDEHERNDERTRVIIDPLPGEHRRPRY